MDTQPKTERAALPDIGELRDAIQQEYAAVAVNPEKDARRIHPVVSVP